MVIAEHSGPAAWDITLQVHCPTPDKILSFLLRQTDVETLAHCVPPEPRDRIRRREQRAGSVLPD